MAYGLRRKQKELHGLRIEYLGAEGTTVLNPFTPTSDQGRISPYNINTISSRQVMRIEKNINDGIIS